MHIALPLMAGSLVETLYNLTDAFFLGKLGPAEIAAPSLAFSIIFFFIVAGNGLAGAGLTLIAQAKGRGEPERMCFYANQVTTFLAVLSIALGVLGVLLSGLLLDLLGTPLEVRDYALVYMRIVFIGLPFSFIYFSFQAALTAIGDSLTPLLVHVAAVLINLGLDPLLIFGVAGFPRLGVAGAAIATVCSQALAAALSLVILFRGKGGLRLSWKLLRPRASALALIVKIGLPSSLGQGLSAFGFTVLQGLVNHFGTSAIAAFGVGNRLIGLFDIPSHGIAQATTSLSGQAIGAGDEAEAHRVVRTALLAVFCLLTPLLTLSFFYGGDLVRFFVADAEAMRLGALMFQIVGPSVLLFGLYLVLTGAFQGSGATRVIMVLALARLWLIRVPLAYTLEYVFKLGPVSIWYAMFVSNALTALAGFVYYKRGPWMRALL